MQRVLLFLTMCIVPGFGAALGSIVGNAFGKTGLFVGAVLGGLIGVTAGTRLASWRGWIPRPSAPRVYVFSAIGFLIAALIAGNNLWTPLIPVAATCIVGIAAVIAAGRTA